MTENQDAQTSADDPEPQNETAVVADAETEVAEGVQTETAAEVETETVTEVEAEAVAEAETETVTEAETEAVVGVAEIVEVAEVEAESAEGVQPVPKRRISTGRLFTAALAIGVLGGVGAGYAVQSSRPPTPLPPLTATQPKYAPVGVYQGIAPPMLPASQDDASITEGDLTSLLLPEPAGASTENSIWIDQMIGVEGDASLCDDQAACFTNELGEGVVAVADTNWTTGNGYSVEIRMFRYAAGDSAGADQMMSDLGDDQGSGTNSIPMPTGIDATGYEYYDSYHANDDHAAAVHGDIVVLFWVTSTTKVPNPSIIDGLIKQQMGRL